MKTIYKYNIPNLSRQVVKLPHASSALCVHAQGLDVMLWCTVDTDNQVMDEHEFLVLATGQEVPEDIDLFYYIGSAFAGSFVWHIFSRSLGDVRQEKTEDSGSTKDSGAVAGASGKTSG